MMSAFQLSGCAQHQGWEDCKYFTPQAFENTFFTHASFPSSRVVCLGAWPLRQSGGMNQSAELENLSCACAR